MVNAAREYAEYKRRCDKYVNVVVMAIEMPDGTMVTPEEAAAAWWPQPLRCSTQPRP